MSTPSKTIAFFGASGGCGLNVLKGALAAGHQCIALARKPAKFTEQFPPSQYPNLIVIEGNAHDATAVAKCLVSPSEPSRIVDTIAFTIGSPFNMGKMTTEDPDVCKKGMAAVVEALAEVRKNGASGRPKIAAISTTGISKSSNDVPLLMRPMYSFMLKVPHADKEVMEQIVLKSGEDYVLVRPSFLVDGAKPDRKIRVGVESQDGSNVVSKEVGYGISREDTGRWIYENLIGTEHPEYNNMVVSITW